MDRWMSKFLTSIDSWYLNGLLSAYLRSALSVTAVKEAKQRKLKAKGALRV